MLKIKKSTKPKHKNLLIRRKATAASVVLVTFLFLLFYNLALYFFIQQMGGYLETALDSRLKTAASLTAKFIERDITDIYDASEQSLLRIILAPIRRDNDLEAAYLIDPFYNLILDSRLDLELTVSRGYLLEDSTAIKKAVLGTLSTSKLHTVAGSHFKNVYAPVYDILGNKAILVLEANAQFLNIIRFFERGLWFGVITSVALLILLTLFLIAITTLFLRTEDQLQKSRRLASMGQMAATVAHEIRNPLGIIKGTADLLSEKYQPQDEPDELFEFINEEVKRLNGLVNDYLTLAKEPNLKLKKTDLIVLIKDAISKFQLDHERNCTISFHSNLSSLFLLLDSELIFQVLLNLIINATQAVNNKKSNISLSLETHKIRGKPFAKTMVTDNGYGIKGNPDEIFEPFFTTKTKGSGLGLAVSRNIIELHGGRIEAKNRSEGGTTIEFYLPIK